ncbi:MAG: hypothetical protein KatS3mg051_1549 [Anaerolineae bacterium]|nr:MAG: hypothetical protein KatS3mg051_1549 [Anaerolineae bacterium]
MNIYSYQDANNAGDTTYTFPGNVTLNAGDVVIVVATRRFGHAEPDLPALGTAFLAAAVSSGYGYYFGVAKLYKVASTISITDWSVDISILGSGSEPLEIMIVHVPGVGIEADIGCNALFWPSPYSPREFYASPPATSGPFQRITFACAQRGVLQTASYWKIPPSPNPPGWLATSGASENYGREINLWNFESASYLDEASDYTLDVNILLFDFFIASNAGSQITPLIAWVAQDDLPTEDITRANFVRRALEIAVPVSYEPNGEVELINPVITGTLYRGMPRNSSRTGGSIRIELEPIEARWQRAVSKRPFQQVGSYTGAQTLQALLTQRQAEFEFLQWETIPDLYWPDGTIPTLVNPATQLDENTSVFDEVLQILAAFPGYTVDWTPDDRLRIVIPPFAPNAPAPKILTARDGNFVRTGYVKTEVVRSVRVKSQPYAFSGGRELVVQPVALRLADQEFANNPLTNKPDVSTRGNISAASTTLNVLDASIFAVGDWLYIAGAGTGGQPLTAQITAVSGNTITLDTAASTSANDVLVRYLHNYPPPPDNIGIESTARQYGPGYIEASYVQPFVENTIVATGTVQASVRLDTWRLPALPPPLPYQTTDQAVDIPITTNWTNVYTGNLRDRLAMIFETNGNRIYVDARVVENGVEWRIRASTYGDGGANVGAITIRRWLAAFRFVLEARASVWKRGAATFSAEYRNPDGYLDLPEVDVSATGITSSEQLQRLARLIAEYRSRQAAQWTLELSQPWALLPTDKGRRLELPGGVVVVADGYRLGINYGAQDVAAPLVCNAWQYTQLTYILSNEAGDLLARADGDVLGR